MNPANVLGSLKFSSKDLSSSPVHRQPARLHDHVLLLSGKRHQVHEQLYVVLAILTDFFFAAFAPPLDDFQSVAGFLVSQRFPCEVIQLDANPKYPCKKSKMLSLA